MTSCSNSYTQQSIFIAKLSVQGVLFGVKILVCLSLPPDVASIAQYPELSIRFQLKAYWNINNLA